jgi:hypothetical protein
VASDGRGVTVGGSEGVTEPSILRGTIASGPAIAILIRESDQEAGVVGGDGVVIGRAVDAREMMRDGGRHRAGTKEEKLVVSAHDSSMALTVADPDTITSPRNTAKTPTLFGIRAEKIIPIFQTVGTGARRGDGGDWRRLGRGVDDQTELPLISKMMKSLGRQWHEFVGERSSTSQRKMTERQQERQAQEGGGGGVVA